MFLTFIILYIQSLCFFLCFSLIYEQAGGAVYIYNSGSVGTFISCSWTGNNAPSDKVSDMFSKSLSTNFIHNNNREFNHTKYSQYSIASLLFIYCSTMKFHQDFERSTPHTITHTATPLPCSASSLFFFL